MSYKLFGIPNCDTVKKARKAIEARGVSYDFVDFKKIAPTKADLSRWSEFLGGELPVNKRGTTFRALKSDWEAGSSSTQYKLLMQNPSAIKRPILEVNGKVLMIGHDSALIEKLET